MKRSPRNPSLAALALVAGIIAAAATMALAPSTANAGRCTGTCGDGSTFDKPASTCDACRMLQCPRTCKLEGVTTCLWCNRTAQVAPQQTGSTQTVRLGPNPNNPGAPTGPIQGGGTTILIPRTPLDGPRGTVIVPIEIVSLSLTSISPIIGPGEVRKWEVLPSLGEMENVIPDVDFPTQSFFDVFFEYDFPAFPRPLHNTVAIRYQVTMRSDDPIAQEAIGEAPVTWPITNGPIPLADPDGVIQAWILDGSMTIVFAGDDGTGIPLPPEPAATVSESWGHVKSLYR
ncbi:MAG: hypothetical protein ACKVU1_03640 [bacterium]